ncbi:MAG TPA: alpha/beta fold hydrolase [Candidatus Cybelea sp.]|nr:alpha/beta fold hydrolase [Candidatus Cybelea sp.]
MIASPDSRPARDFDEAVRRARAVMALDDDSILPEGKTALLDHGAKTPLAVVLFHGITNNPAQYAQFAPMLHAKGVNVFVPRMPEHGARDRMTDRIAKLTAEALLASASEAVDIAFGLGDRVALLGISMGGTLAAYFGETRAIELAVPVAPDFALLQLPYGVSRMLAWLFLRLPNFFFWWDPRVQAKQRPLTAYPRCSTHALMQTMRVSDEVCARAKAAKPLAQQMVTVVNRCDPAVNNEATEQVATEWSGSMGKAAQYVVMRTLPENHDIIDPQNPQARTDLVYPKLLEVLGVS